MDSTIHVAIGNDHDRLPQRDWARYVRDVDDRVRRDADPLYGFWVSPSTDVRQNAAWAFRVPVVEARDPLKRDLAAIASGYGMDFISWNQSVTELVGQRAPDIELPLRSHS